MKKFTKDPLALLSFGTIEDRRKYLNSSGKEYFCLPTLLTLFFVAADCAPLFFKWDSVLEERISLVILLTVVSAVVLDLPMYIAGKAIREYQDRLRTKKSMYTIVIPAVIAFLLIFIPFIVFSFFTKEATFSAPMPIGSDAGFESGAVVIPENKMAVPVAAVFQAIIPLATSIASMLTGLKTYHPLNDKLNKLQTVKALAEEQRARISEGIAQASDRMSLLRIRETDLYDNFKNEIMVQEQIRIQAYEEALQEQLNEEGILRVTENAFKYLDSSSFDEEYKPLIADALNDPVIAASTAMTKINNMTDTSGSVA